MTDFRKKLAINLSIGLVVIIGLGLAIYFFISNINEYNEKINETRDALSERLAISKSFSDLRNVYENEGKQYLAVMKNILTTEDGLIDVSKSLQFLANKEGLEYGFKFTGDPVPPTENDLGYASFDLNLRGGFSKIINFLESLKTFRFLVSLDNLNLSLSGEGVYSAQIRGRVFYR